MLVLGLGGATISIVSGDFSLAISGMSLASVVGIILNIILPNDKELTQNEKDWNIPSEKEAAIETLKTEVKNDIKEVKKAVSNKKKTKKTTKKK